MPKTQSSKASQNKGLLLPLGRSQTERRKWTREEDIRLQQSIQKYGTKNWCIIAATIPDRHPKQCRERWINHLDPQISKTKISEEEWNIVLRTHVEQGNRWSEIAKLLPGRTPNQIKNYWHTMMRRAQKASRENEEASDDRFSDESPSVSPRNHWSDESPNISPQVSPRRHYPVMHNFQDISPSISPRTSISHNFSDESPQISPRRSISADYDDDSNETDFYFNFPPEQQQQQQPIEEDQNHGGGVVQNGDPLLQQHHLQPLPFQSQPPPDPEFLMMLDSIETLMLLPEDEQVPSITVEEFKSEPFTNEDWDMGLGWPL